MSNVHWKLISLIFLSRISLLRLIKIFCLILITACGGIPEDSSEGAEAPALLQLVSGTQTDFLGIREGSNQSALIEIQNLSMTVPATNLQLSEGLASPFGFTGGAFPGNNGTCGSTLGIGAVCSFEIDVTSPTVGTFSDGIILDYFDGVENQQLSIGLSAEFDPPAPIAIDGGVQLGANPVIPPGGSDRMLLFMHSMDIDNSDSDLTNVTFGGQAMTQAGEIMATTGYRTRVEMWLCNEACIVGAVGNSFNLSYDNGATRYPVFHSILLNGVNQANPVHDIQLNSNNGTASLVVGPLQEVEGGITLVNAAHGDLASMTINTDGNSSSQATVEVDDVGSLQVRQIVGFYQDTDDSVGTTYTVNASSSQRMVGIALSFNPR